VTNSATNDAFQVEVPPEVRATMNRIGNGLARQLPPGWGFGLFLFHYGDNATLTWISSAERAEMLLMLQTFIRAHEDRTRRDDGS
jgi:hypothetical protein